MNPVIAITPEAITTDMKRGRGAFCSVSVIQAIEAAGGVPLILPLTRETGVLDHFLQSCHGLLLSGGGDLTAKYYSPPLTEAERATIILDDEVRDEMEIYLIREALDADIPLLGICRGIQVMNVAVGGTLIPDIKIRYPEALTHDLSDPEAWAHPADWEAAARLTEVLGSGCELINSAHHQAVDEVAPGFEVAARAPDGIVEAFEKVEARFVCGVQFHPDRMLRVAPQFLRLFEALVDACRH